MTNHDLVQQMITRLELLKAEMNSSIYDAGIEVAIDELYEMIEEMGNM